MHHLMRTLVLSLLLLSGCTTYVTEPVGSLTIARPYKPLASCSYDRIEAAAGHGLKKTDLEHESRITLEGNGHVFWQVSFVEIGPALTKVNAERLPGLNKPDLLKAVQECVS
jgi:hypothetical protein